MKRGRKATLLKHILAKFRGDRTRQPVYILLHSIGAKSLWSVSCGKASLSQKTVTSKKSFQAKYLEALSFLAERVGFEPTVAHHHT